jgi:hypothetical protein
MTVKNKLLTGSLFGAPPAGGTLAGLVALKFGVPLDLVILGATAIAQGLQALASLVHRRRKAKQQSRA